MRPEIQKFLWDATDALRCIGEFTAGQSFDAYRSDIMRRSAVERQFEIVGEALNQASRLAPLLTERIPELPRIVAFRNMLIHGDASVDDLLVWEIATTRVTALLEQIKAIKDI